MSSYEHLLICSSHKLTSTILLRRYKAFLFFFKYSTLFLASATRLFRSCNRNKFKSCNRDKFFSIKLAIEKSYLCERCKRYALTDSNFSFYTMSRITKNQSDFNMVCFICARLSGHIGPYERMSMCS